MYRQVMDRQCPSCGGFCEADCERENVKSQREWVGFSNGEKAYMRALGYVGIDDIEEKLKRRNTWPPI